MTEEQSYMVGVDALIKAKRQQIAAELDISDIYPETIFKRPCSYCENEDSINICDQCCFKYDSWFKKKEKKDDIR